MCKNILLADLLGSQLLLEILQISFTFKSIEKSAKKWMFRETFAMESTIFFWNEGRLLCKHIDVALNHKEVGI